MNEQKVIEITEEVAQKVLQVVDAGLTPGVGKPIPGQMCIMAAINYALGREHGDNPGTCVGSAVRRFDIVINDALWSSDKARAQGMRREAIGKLGSNTLDQTVFAQKITLKVIQKILPIALRAAKLEPQAVACENAVDLETARKAVAAASYAAASYAATAADAATAATAAASYAAAAARYAADAAADAAAADAAAADAAAAARYVAAAARDKILTLACELAVEVLQEMGSPGCAFLELCND